MGSYGGCIRFLEPKIDLLSGGSISFGAKDTSELLNSLLKALPKARSVSDKVKT